MAQLERTQAAAGQEVALAYDVAVRLFLLCYSCLVLTGVGRQNGLRPDAG